MTQARILSLQIEDKDPLTENVEVRITMEVDFSEFIPVEYKDLINDKTNSKTVLSVSRSAYNTFIAACTLDPKSKDPLKGVPVSTKPYPEKVEEILDIKEK